MLGLLLSVYAPSIMAQSVLERAEKQTSQMAAKMKLNESDYQKLKQFNLERLQKIEALSQLREQDNRYLDLRLDQIEEEYHSRLFNTLSKKQFTAYQNYKKDQPYTYASLTMKTNNAIAIDMTE